MCHVWSIHQSLPSTGNGQWPVTFFSSLLFKCHQQIYCALCSRSLYFNDPWSLMTSPRSVRPTLFFAIVVPVVSKNFKRPRQNQQFQNRIPYPTTLQLTKDRWLGMSLNDVQHDRERVVRIYFFWSPLLLLKHLIWCRFLFRLASCSPLKKKRKN